jgi:hypothetical protein
MNDPTASRDDPLAGSIRQTSGELASLSARLDAGVVPGEAMAALLLTLAGELREAAAAITRRPADHGDGTDAVRSFLTAVAVALDIPAPRAPEDERGYWRTRSARADEVLRAAAAITGSAPDPLGLTGAGRLLSSRLRPARSALAPTRTRTLRPGRR